MLKIRLALYVAALTFAALANVNFNAEQVGNALAALTPIATN